MRAAQKSNRGEPAREISPRAHAEKHLAVELQRKHARVHTQLSAVKLQRNKPRSGKLHKRPPAAGVLTIVLYKTIIAA